MSSFEDLLGKITENIERKINDPLESMVVDERNQNFTIHQNEVTKSLMFLSPIDRDVYEIITMYAYGNKNYSFPSVATMGLMMDRDVKIIRQSISNLERMGLVLVFPRIDFKSLIHKSNVYVLLDIPQWIKDYGIEDYDFTEKWKKKKKPEKEEFRLMMIEENMSDRVREHIKSRDEYLAKYEELKAEAELKNLEKKKKKAEKKGVGEKLTHPYGKNSPTPTGETLPGVGEKLPTNNTNLKKTNLKKTNVNKTNLAQAEYLSKIESIKLPDVIKEVLKDKVGRLVSDNISLIDLKTHFLSTENFGEREYAYVLNAVLSNAKDKIGSIAAIMNSWLAKYNAPANNGKNTGGGNSKPIRTEQLPEWWGKDDWKKERTHLSLKALKEMRSEVEENKLSWLEELIRSKIAEEMNLESKSISEINDLIKSYKYFLDSGLGNKDELLLKIEITENHIKFEELRQKLKAM